MTDTAVYRGCFGFLFTAVYCCCSIIAPENINVQTQQQYQSLPRLYKIFSDAQTSYIQQYRVLLIHICSREVSCRGHGRHIPLSCQITSRLVIPVRAQGWCRCTVLLQYSCSGGLCRHIPLCFERYSTCRYHSSSSSSTKAVQQSPVFFFFCTCHEGATSVLNVQSKPHEKQSIVCMPFTKYITTQPH